MVIKNGSLLLRVWWMLLYYFFSVKKHQKCVLKLWLIWLGLTFNGDKW